MGMIYNAITPSGTNRFKGQGSYRMQRQAVCGVPVLHAGPARRPSASRRPTSTSSPFDIGGPIVRDRTHFFGGYEHTERDLSGARGDHDHAGEPGGARPERAALHAARRSTPSSRSARSIIRSARNNRLSVRYIFFDNFIINNIGGGLTSVQRGTDFTDRQHSTAAQLISTIRADAAERAARSVRDARAGPRAGRARPASGPAINVTNVGQLRRSDRRRRGRRVSRSRRTCFQVNDNLTQIRGDHAYKFGFDIQDVADTRTRTAIAGLHVPEHRPRIWRRAAAPTRSATRRSRSTSARPISSTARISTASTCRTTGGSIADVKILYGIRYDVYDVPEPNASAPFEASRDFRRRQEQLGAALRRGVDAGREPPIGDPRQHRHHVRPGAAGDVRAVAHQRRHQPPRRGVVPADHAGRAGVSRTCCPQVRARSRTR